MRGWRFWPYNPAQDTLQDPITSEFFSSEAIKDSADALVRESIQNSLDAVSGDGPVVVRFSLEAEPDRRAFDDVKEQLYGTLVPHVTAERNGLERPVDPRHSGPYVAIEDFGTSGLEGNSAPHTPGADERNDFFAFFRAEGWTNKGEDSMGRWGIGKTVFPRSSRINGFLGWTIRKSDGRSLLMGRCILKGHHIGEPLYLPHGHFAEHDSSGPVPVEDPALIAAVKKAYRLTRKAEPGLSVVVPQIDPEEITGEALIGSVVRNYFYPLLTGKLVVELVVEGNPTVLDRTTVAEHAARLDAEHLHVMRLTEWSMGEEGRDRIRVPAPQGTGAPSWENVEIAPEVLATMRERYLAGAPIALRAEMIVRPRAAPVMQSYMDVLLRRVGEEVVGRPVFIRGEGIVVSDARGKRTPGTIAIVHAAHGALATLLGDSENVAHTIWAKDTKGFKDKYVFAGAFIEYVRGAPAAIVKMLAEGDDEEDVHLLEHFFGLDVEEDPDLPESNAGGERKPADRTIPPKIVVPRRRARYTLTRVVGGFVVSNASEGGPPAALQVRVAYDVRRGNPLGKYHPADFAIGEGRVAIVESDGLMVTGKRGNEIVVQITSPEFKLKVNGFDDRRDLFVKVNVLEDLSDDNPKV